MAGVGISSAIGFVFALSLFANYAPDDEGFDLMQPPPHKQQEQSGTQPSSSLFIQQQQQNMDNDDNDNYDPSSTLDSSSNSQDTIAAEQRSMDSAEIETAPEAGMDASSMMQRSEESASSSSLSSSLKPTLVTLVASDASTGGVIGEVMPHMQFETGSPVFIKAHLANLNSLQISGNVIALGVSSSDNSGGDERRIDSELKDGNSTRALTQHLSYEQASSFRGDIGAGESIELELYWNPVRAGEYKLLVFSITPDELTSPSEELTVVAPMASIPINVTELT